MVNGAFNSLLGSRDFRLQCGDPLVQFRDRKRIEVLTGKFGDQIARPAGKAVVGFHVRNR